ncbi:MAG: hypothetical protein RLP15_14150 [Cryomorphaceae bacterium]
MKTPWLLMLTIGALAVVFLFRFDFWKNDLVIRSDGFAYYGYIQGTLVHHDPLNTFHGELEGDALNRSWMHEGLEGRYLPKMTMGLAYAWVPGFIIADFIAGLTSYPQDGWSRPYQLAVGFTGILFLLIGIYALWNALSHWFSNAVSSLTVLLIVIGTNLLHYGSVENSMSHVYSFALISLFLLFSQKWVSYYKSRDLLIAAFLLGWIILIRPTNGIVGLFLPILLLEKERHLRRLIHVKTVLAAMIAFLPILPQLIFWKLAAGEWLHYSYEQESFFWLNPHIIDGLFSYRNGWLLYTPMMVLALLGIPLLVKQSKGLLYAIITIVGVHIYVTFSWWCWYYGGSLSIRPMIDVYPLLALPLAAFLAWILRKPLSLWIPVFMGIGLLVWNNFLQIKYSNLGIITDSTMTKDAYWATFMQPEKPKPLDFAGLYRDPDTENLRKGLPERLIYDTNYAEPLGYIDISGESKGHLLGGQKRFSKSLEIPGALLPDNTETLLQIRMKVRCENPKENELHAVASFQKEDRNYRYQAANVAQLGVKPNEMSTVRLYTKRPVYFPDDGILQLYAYMTGHGNCEVHSIEVIPMDLKRRPLQ